MKADEKKEWLDKIDSALNEIRPHLAVDKGDVSVVDVSPDFHVKVKWLGNCKFCEMSSMTLRAGIEQTLKNKFPQIQSVDAI